MDTTPSAKSVWTLAIDRKRAAIAVAILFNLLLVSTLLIAAIWREPGLRLAVLAAWAAMSVALLFLVTTAKRFARTLEFEMIAQENHYVQAFTHLMVILYWGLWWREVYSHFILVLVQIVFAYNFEMLLCWFRRQKWRFGFGPFPVVFSMNFFLWFTDKWFCLQLLMLAVSYLAKTYLTWNKNGRRTHIFNPSGFSLTLASVLLLATGAFQVTQSDSLIPSFSIPLNMSQYLFLIILFSNAKFSTTLITGGAGVTMIVLHIVLVAVTGYPLLPRPFDSQVLLGAGLLVTDPATSPTNKAGRALFGIAYGALVYLFAALLHLSGSPGYFDKILPVTILNLLVPWFNSRGTRLSSLLYDRVRAVAVVVRQRAVHLLVWATCFVWATPLFIHENFPVLIPAPTLATNITAAEIETLRKQSGRRCIKYPNMCRPFGFGAELKYWIGPERQEELSALEGQ